MPGPAQRPCRCDFLPSGLALFWAGLAKYGSENQMLRGGANWRAPLVVFLERDLSDSVRSQELELILIFGGISQSW
jgi:hypothetical protein